MNGVDPNTNVNFLGLVNTVTNPNFMPALLTPIASWTATGGGPNTYAGKSNV